MTSPLRTVSNGTAISWLLQLSAHRGILSFLAVALVSGLTQASHVIVRVPSVMRMETASPASRKIYDSASAESIAIAGTQDNGVLPGTQSGGSVSTSSACADAHRAGTARYLLSGAKGANNGTSWSNAWTSITTAEESLSRGQTLCVGDGSYGGATFNVPESGTSRITVKKATVADRGTSSGWSDAFGDGQATFDGGWLVMSGYWTFDGATGGGPGDWECANCGFSISSAGAIFINDTFGCCTGAPINNVIIRHTKVDGHATGPVQTGETGIYLDLAHGFLSEYNFITRIGCDAVKVVGSDNVVFQYTKIRTNYQGVGTACHGDLFESPANHYSNFTARWSFFEDVDGTYLFGAHGGPTVVTGMHIYGNIFYWTTRQPSLNGLIDSIDQGSVSGLVFSNNTIAGNFNSNMGAVDNISGEMRNNLYFANSGSGFNFGTSLTTASSNTCYNQGRGGSAGSSCSQNLRGASPFVNLAERNFNLSAATAAGTRMSSPYDTDMCGNERGADGTVDRGALEFGATKTCR